MSVNFGLIENETSVLEVTCAPWGNWDPPVLPRCIRKNFSKPYILTKAKPCVQKTAVNCTDDPIPAPQTDRGMYDFIDNGQVKSYGTVVHYW